MLEYSLSLALSSSCLPGLHICLSYISLVHLYFSNTLYILLFITGKTMTANAVANYLGKKLLLVTVSLLTDNQINKVLISTLVFIYLNQHFSSFRIY